MELLVFALVVAAILIFRVFKLDRFWEDDEDVAPVKCYKCGTDRQRKTRSEINETELETEIRTPHPPVPSWRALFPFTPHPPFPTCEAT